MSSVQTGQPGASPGGLGLGLSLLVIATAQLMLVLDDTIANIALPSIQRELSVPASTLPWIINAYILAFGGLLLFGGRVGDLFGRRRVFRAGIGLFTVASLVGGLGVNAEMLIGARALQGLGAALTAPNALALIATNFPVGKPRNSAMAVYGGEHEEAWGGRWQQVLAAGRIAAPLHDEAVLAGRSHGCRNPEPRPGSPAEGPAA